MLERLWLGRRGERHAARFLRRHHGHRRLLENYRCPLGEIDLITLDGGMVVFVEVKTRRSDELGDPIEAVRRDKQKRLKRAANHFINRFRLHDRPARFDVVTIIWPKRGKPEVSYYEDAFQ